MAVSGDASKPTGAITRLLRAWNQGDQRAGDELIELVYPDLRRQAARRLRRERRGHTLEPTALVNEVFLKLLDQGHVTWRDRVHFLGAAGEMMRRVLVDHARARRAQKRGGAPFRVSLNDALIKEEARDVDALALEGALAELRRLDPQQGRIVELRFFAGLSIEETAQVMDLSPATIKRDFRVARAFLHRRLGGS